MSEVPRKKRRKSNPDGDQPIPFGSTFDELFKGDKAIGLKIAGGAAAASITVFVTLLKMQDEHPLSTASLAAGVLGAAVVGALLGAALSLKDIVVSRMKRRKPVFFPLRVLFGYGVISLLLVWVPFAIVATIFIPFKYIR